MARYRRRYRLNSVPLAPVSTTPPVPTIHNFANVTEWLGHCQGPSEMSVDDRVSQNQGDRSFRGTSSFEETLKLAQTGWLEGVEEARKISADILVAARSRAYQKTFRPHRVGGGTLLMGRYLQNIPDCYLKLQKTQTNKFVTLVLHGVSAAGVDADVLIRRGATATAIVEVLEMQRVRVRVELVFRVNGSRCSHTWRICLKDFNESLDMDRLSFFLANPSSQRRLQRAASERLSAADRRDLGIPGGGYGHVSDVESQGDIYFEPAKLEPKWSSIESCAEYLRSVLREQGVEV